MALANPLSGEALSPSEMEDAWPFLSADERIEGCRCCRATEAEDFFLALPTRDQAELVLWRSRSSERRSWMRLLPPDDAADLMQEAPDEERDGLLALLDEPTRKRGDRAAGLRRGRGRRPDESALRPPAPGHDRRRGHQLPAPAGARPHRRPSTTPTCWTASSTCSGVVSFRELFAASADQQRRRHHAHRLVTVPEEHGPGGGQPRLLRPARPGAIPVVDGRGPHEGHRHRRRHRRRRPGGGHRGHPEARRHGGPRRALPGDRLSCA